MLRGIPKTNFADAGSPWGCRLSASRCASFRPRRAFDGTFDRTFDRTFNGTFDGTFRIQSTKHLMEHSEYSRRSIRWNIPNTVDEGFDGIFDANYGFGAHFEPCSLPSATAHPCFFQDHSTCLNALMLVFNALILRLTRNIDIADPIASLAQRLDLRLNAT